MFIGITGGIACGKSAVSDRLVRHHGAALIDADQIARDVTTLGEAELNIIFDTFGLEMRKPDGTLDRVRLGMRVFANPQDLKALEMILHPAIERKIRSQLEQYTTQEDPPLVVVDIPLLFEKGWHELGLFEYILVVSVSSPVQIARLRQRDQLTEAEAKLRISSQWPLSRKCAMADFVIDNNGTLKQTWEQVDAFMQKIRDLEGKGS